MFAKISRLFHPRQLKHTRRFVDPEKSYTAERLEANKKGCVRVVPSRHMRLSADTMKEEIEKLEQLGQTG
jgi:hypothetical protein